MAVTFAEDCFDPEGPVDAEDEDLDDDDDGTGGTGHYEDGWEAEPRFRVVTDTVERAADALLVVAERLMRVGESGTEHDLASPTGEDDRTPSVAHVSIDSDAAYVSADTSEWLSHEMAATMKRILADELDRAGVSAVVEADYDPIRGIRAERWTGARR